MASTGVPVVIERFVVGLYFVHYQQKAVSGGDDTGDDFPGSLRFDNQGAG